MTSQNHQITSIPSNSTVSSRSPDITTTLIYGGVAVAVIIAMSYFSQVLLRGIKELLQDDNDK